MSVEGVNKSAIARMIDLSWNTVARWLERAAIAAMHFNQAHTRGFNLIELQADEILARSERDGKPLWVFATIEVWSRLWPSTVVRARTSKNTKRLFREVVRAARIEERPLITTDGFGFYGSVLKKVFGPACLYGKVIKTWRNNRVRVVKRTAVIGSERELMQALERSEDSDHLNTAFIERLNLMIRQGSSYLARRSPAHARSPERLREHLELLRCYYNFMRPHRALKFGRVQRAPA